MFDPNVEGLSGMAPIRTSNGSVHVMLFSDRLTDKGRAALAKAGDAKR